MPRNVRNSWVDLSVDGRSDIGTGPVSKDGKLHAQFYVRDNGCVEESVSVSTWAFPDGRLALVVKDPDGNIIFEHKTTR